jgi:hypothetical protein
MGLGSRIWDPRFGIPDPGPGVNNAPDPGSATLINSYNVALILMQLTIITLL